MMRPMFLVLAGIGVGMAGAAGAQSAHNTPEGIVCAMTGSCGDAANADKRLSVGNEKAFSLARATAAPATSTAMSHPSGVAARAHAMTAARSPRQSYAPRVRPGGGLDMLVNFPLGSATLTPQAQAEARAFAQAMAAPQMSGLHFAIEGHTDATGDRTRNMTLSQARAQSVVDYLVGQGVDPSRLSAKGFGPDRPVPGVRATAPANRRVEFVKQS